MCETREHFCHRLLDLSKLEVLFKCNDLHLFPVSFFIIAILLKEGEAKQKLLHPTRVSPPCPIFSPGGVPLMLFRLFLPQLACWQQRLILAAISRRIML